MKYEDDYEKEGKGIISQIITWLFIGIIVACLGYILLTWFMDVTEFKAEQSETALVMEDYPADTSQSEEDTGEVCTTYKSTVEAPPEIDADNGERIGWVYFPEGDGYTYSIFASDMTGGTESILDYNGLVFDTNTKMPIYGNDIDAIGTETEDGEVQLDMTEGMEQEEYTPAVMFGHSYPNPMSNYPGNNILALEDEDQYIIVQIQDTTYVLKSVDYYTTGAENGNAVYVSENDDRIRIYTCTFAAPFVNTITGRGVGEYELVGQYTDCK